jgi:uncharacterized membrane protein YphA (DoxX/SURF4 family)
MGKSARLKRERREAATHAAEVVERRQLPLFWMTIALLVVGGIAALVMTAPSDAERARSESASKVPQFADVTSQGDALPTWTGVLELAGGVLLMLGLFVRQTALVLSLEAILAYVLISQPRTLWPIRNGGIEALLYFVIFLYFAAAGAGAWSLDARRRYGDASRPVVASS